MIGQPPSLVVPSVDRQALRRIAAGLAGLVSVVYFVIAADLAPGDVTSPPTPVMFIAGMSYLIGAGLILFNRRRLLIIGAVLNPLVIVAFLVSVLLGRAELELLSVLSKLAQVCLEVVLLLLIFRVKARPVA